MIIDMYGNRYTIDKNDSAILYYEDGDNDNKSSWSDWLKLLVASPNISFILVTLAIFQSLSC